MAGRDEIKESETFLDQDDFLGQDVAGTMLFSGRMKRDSIRTQKVGSGTPGDAWHGKVHRVLRRYYKDDKRTNETI